MLSERKRKLLKYLIYMGIAGMLGVLGLFLYIAPTLPSMEEINDVQYQIPLRVYSADGDMIAEFGEKRRIPLRYEDIPQPMIHAVLAAEDDAFFDHIGVDFQGLIRAALTVAMTGEKSQGGSTITMQVARNLYLTKEKTYTRKIREIFLSFKMEYSLEKEEILTLYFNKIFLGHRSYGFAAAAQTYYGRDLNKLNLAQYAMLAGLPKAPSTYNPVVNPKRALIRRNHILHRMLDLNFITQEQYDVAIAYHDDAEIHGLSNEVEAPYVAEMVRLEMEERYGDEAYTRGFHVYTTVRSRLQGAANKALRKNLHAYNERHGYRGAVKHLDVPINANNQQWINLLAKRDTIEAKLDNKRPEHRLLGQFIRYGREKLAMDEWQDELDKVPTAGDLKVGLVSNLDEQTANIYLANGQVARIDWDGLSWAASYINDNAMGRAPKRAKDILKVGDVIYLRQDEQGLWRLAFIPEVEGALVSLNPDDGSVLALVGGFDFYRSKFNRVTLAERQPGSNFKPFIYSAALEKGYTAASIVNDAPIRKQDAVLEGDWKPENYSNIYRGPIRIRVALSNSINTVAIRVLDSIGRRFAINHAAKFGIPTDRLPYDLSLALGSGSVKPIDLVSGYAVFANGGYRISPYVIDRIEDNDGTVVFQNNPVRVCEECIEEPPVYNEEGEEISDGSKGLQVMIDADLYEDQNDMDLIARDESALDTPQNQPVYPAKRAISPQNAYIMTSILGDVIRHGTGRRALSLGRSDLSGKTGTTNDQVDAWFSGFNQHIVTTAWVGFDNPRSMGRSETGARAALPMWIDYMQVALADVPDEPRPMPPGLVTVRIDPVSGKLASPNNPEAIFEIFRVENVPQETEDQPYTNIQVDTGDVREGEEAPQVPVNGSTATEQLF